MYEYKTKRLRNHVVLNTIVNTIEILAVKIHNGSGTVHLARTEFSFREIIVIVCIFSMYYLTSNGYSLF